MPFFFGQLLQLGMTDIVRQPGHRVGHFLWQRVVQRTLFAVV